MTIKKASQNFQRYACLAQYGVIEGMVCEVAFSFKKVHKHLLSFSGVPWLAQAIDITFHPKFNIIINNVSKHGDDYDIDAIEKDQDNAIVKCSRIYLFRDSP